MPRLIPTRLTNSVADLLIPQEMKQQVVDAFVEMTADISPDTFQSLVDMDVSIWQSLFNDEIRVAMIDGAISYRQWIKLVDERLALKWIVAARPELSKVMNTESGRMWFYKQWNEIMKAVGV